MLVDQILTNVMLILVCFSAFLFRNSKKELRNSLFLSAILLAYFAFHFSPSQDMDLAHHFVSVNLLKNSGRFFDSTQIDVLLGFRLLLLIVSKLSSVHYLPAIVAFFTYGITFYIIYDYANSNDKRCEVWIVITLFCFTLSYIGTISNMRNTMSVTMFIFALYLELQKRKSKIICWLMMIFAASIHPAVTVFIFIRLLLIIYTKYTKQVIMLGLFFFPLALWYIVPQISDFISVPYISYLIEKIQLYIFEASEFNVRRYYVCLFQLLMFTYIIMRYRKKNSLELGKWDAFVLCVLIFTYAVVGKYILLTRMNNALLLLCCPYIISESRIESENGLVINRFAGLCIVFSIVMLFVHNFYSGFYYASNYIWWGEI